MRTINNDIEHTIGWWREAGVDVIVGDEPRSWLEDAKPPEKDPKAGKSPKTADMPAKPLQMPADLAAFRAWLLSTEALGAPAADSLDAIGDPASGLMILVDMPEKDDRQGGQLLSGDTGRLFDRMLAAIGRDRASAYIAPLAPMRVAGGTIDDNGFDILARAARHHVALARPDRLLLMGDTPSRVFCGASLNESRGKKHIFNHDGGTVSVTATFHPRFLLRQPRLKAQSWKDLQMMIEGMTA
ncbi:uracil-DNA glycosylase [Parasphingopyxis algicola]|uniref:uracil-DNA glycosylase family protein n=1 Tax=Parasphingopyxis algicola TaxID=2026624 RepID=UPI0015A08ABE|nr:uracil-DNA glycosylase family protein [Parasphingopyxis algicola]QLC24336.1 uracil-DNA glycosylase [Parasphingopyxis algicola]